MDKQRVPHHRKSVSIKDFSSSPWTSTTKRRHNRAHSFINTLFYPASSSSSSSAHDPTHLPLPSLRHFAFHSLLHPRTLIRQWTSQDQLFVSTAPSRITSQLDLCWHPHRLENRFINKTKTLGMLEVIACIAGSISSAVSPLL